SIILAPLTILIQNRILLGQPIEILPSAVEQLVGCDFLISISSTQNIVKSRPRPALSLLSAAANGKPVHDSVT
ncbi:hypothetical protein NPIL_394231, partial [Nephila pilipes]